MDSRVYKKRILYKSSKLNPLNKVNRFLDGLRAYLNPRQPQQETRVVLVDYVFRNKHGQLEGHVCCVKKCAKGNEPPTVYAFDPLKFFQSSLPFTKLELEKKYDNDAKLSSFGIEYLNVFKYT